LRFFVAAAGTAVFGASRIGVARVEVIVDGLAAGVRGRWVLGSAASSTAFFVTTATIFFGLSLV
jgi:hypothetical protein